MNKPGKSLKIVLLLTVLSLHCKGNPTEPLALARYPYIQNSRPDRVSIVWKTSTICDSKVLYGYGGNYDNEAGNGTAHSTSHNVILTGLEPGTKYNYRVYGNDTSLTSGDTFFQTGHDEKGFTFVVFGDSGVGNKPQRKVAELIENIAPDLLLHTGDVVYNTGREEEYDPKFFVPYKDIIKSVPLYPCLGNHDLRTENGRPYLDAFVLPDRESGTERYYSFDYANAHFISLDVLSSAYAPGSGQYNWLEGDLAATDKTWKIVFFHVPAYSSWLRHVGSDVIQKNLSPLLEKYGVDIVFSGHVHAYERTYPIKAGRVSGDGIVYVVSGGGGARLEEPDNYTNNSWSGHVESAHHVTKITIDGGSMVLEAVKPGPGGEVVFDSHTIVKRK